MSKPIHCPECGSVIKPDQPGPLCPRCALKGALNVEPDEGESPDSVNAAPEAGERIGHYKLLEKIGEGGCGVVYMAEQERPVRRRVALKVIKLGMDTREVVARFEVERQALALMDHPHIARIFDGGATQSGRPYFVMELVNGVRITDYCDQQSLSTRERLALFIQVCQAVQHAHQKGIIHRDLKPSNILVSVNDGIAAPKVIDFGIAKAIGQPLTDKTLFTKFQQFRGSPAYASPEQAQMTSSEIDTRSDIYSLGVLLYELLTDRLPFDPKELLAVGVEAMLRTIREQEPARPSARFTTLTAADRLAVARLRRTEAPKLIELLRGDLDWVVMKCLEKERARRYETARELAQDIERHLNDESVIARPPTKGYRVRKFVRRHRTAVSFAGAFLLLLASATGVSLWLAAKANLERAKSVEAERAAKTAREAAETEASQRLAVLTDVQIQRAEDLFAADQGSRGLAYLASVLENNPSNRVAAERLLSALTSRHFSVPLSPPIPHPNGVYHVELSADVGRILTVSSNGLVQIWDTSTGAPLTQPLQQGTRAELVRFSPDGTSVVTASSNTVTIWNMLKGNSTVKSIEVTNRVKSIEFSSDSLWFVTLASDLLSIWDTRSGERLSELSDDGLAAQVVFSPEGGRLAVALANRARIWDRAARGFLSISLRHEAPLRRVQFRPDGQQIVTMCHQGIIKIWDATTGQLQMENPLETRPVFLMGSHLHFGANRLKVAVGARDDTIQILDGRTGKPLTEPLLHDSNVQAAEFSGDGRRLVTISSDKTMRIWDGETGKLVGRPVRVGNWSPLFKWSDDGLRVATSGGRSSQVWDTWTAEPLLGSQFDNYQRILSADLRKFALVDTNFVQVWDARSGISLAEPLLHDTWVRSISFDKNGTRLVTATAAAQPPTLWEVETGKRLTPLRPRFGRTLNTNTGQLARQTAGMSQIQTAEFTPDGRRLITISSDRKARVWDVKTGTPLTEPLASDSGNSLLNPVEFTPDQKQAAIIQTNFVRLINTETGAVIGQPLEHTGKVWSVQFSPDGRQLITASLDQTARLWDTKTGQPIGSPWKHPTGLLGVRFSQDGLRAATWAFDKKVRIWDVSAGTQVSEFAVGNELIRNVQFSPEGTRVVTVSRSEERRAAPARPGGGPAETGSRRIWDARNGMPVEMMSLRVEMMSLRVWDAQTGEAITESFSTEGLPRSTEFTADGLRIINISILGTVSVWAADTGKPVTPPLRNEGQPSLWNPSQINPDGSRLLTVSNSVVTIWNLQDGKLVGAPLEHEDRVRSAVFSRNGQWIITSTTAQTLQVWDAQTGAPLYGAIQSPARDLRSIDQIASSSDGLQFITVSIGKAQLWDTRSGRPINHPISINPAPNFVAFSPDGQKLVTISYENSVRIWDLQTGQPFTEPFGETSGVLRGGDTAELHPDGSSVITFRGSVVEVGDPIRGEWLFKPLLHDHPVKSAQFSPDGLRILTICHEAMAGAARLWDAKTGKRIGNLQHDNPIGMGQFSPDGLRVVTASSDRTARVWDAASGTLLKEIENTQSLVTARFSPDGLRIVTASVDGTVRIWDIGTGKPVSNPIRAEVRLISAEFSTDGTRILTHSTGCVQLWDALSGRLLIEPIRHQGEIESAQFTPDGLRVIVASSDRVVRMWDAKTGRSVAEPIEYKSQMQCARVSPDGRRLVIGSTDRTARIWDLTMCSEPVPSWLPRLAAGVAGLKLTSTGTLEPADIGDLLKIKAELQTAASTNFYVRWGKWFFADRLTRTISPTSPITVAEFIERRLEERTVEGLAEVCRLAPTNGVAFARLAEKSLEGRGPESNQPPNLAEADALSRRAAELSPNNAEVQQIRTRIVEQFTKAKAQ